MPDKKNRPEIDLSLTGARNLRDLSTTGLLSAKGIDAPAHFRPDAPAVEIPGLQSALNATFANPYSSRDERDGLTDSPDRSGTRPGVHDKVRSMTGLLTIAQCRLSARGAEHEDLVLAYFADRQLMPGKGIDIRKKEEQWRKARQDLPMFESAKATQHAVLCALRLYLQSTSGAQGRSQLRGLKSRIMGDVVREDRDDLSQAVMLAATDFTHHTDLQLDKTLKKLKAAKLKPRRAKAQFMKMIEGAFEETDDIFGPLFDGLSDQT
jgi:hypothetical protein